MYQYNTTTIRKITNHDDIAKGNIKDDNPNWSHIPDDLYRILIIEVSGSGETNALLNLIKQ